MQVTVVRIYLTEAEGKLRRIMKLLYEEEALRGVTVFRAISGYGPAGHVHSSGLLDVSLDLPLVVEFFDTPERIDRVLADIGHEIEAGHLLTWSAECNLDD
jgi:PII-like signaling protein